MGFANMSDNTASPDAAVPAAPQPAGSRRWLGLVLGLCVAGTVAGGLGWFFHHKPAAPAPELALEKLGVSRPDALLETASLSQLPKDLLSVPFLRDTLTEDFVFYYETHGDRLGLIGSLRRIIYEHDLKLQDNLIEQLFDQPADIALWRGADGRLKDFLLVMDRQPVGLVAVGTGQAAGLDEAGVGADQRQLPGVAAEQQVLRGPGIVQGRIVQPEQHVAAL